MVVVHKASFEPIVSPSLRAFAKCVRNATKVSFLIVVTSLQELAMNVNLVEMDNSVISALVSIAEFAVIVKFVHLGFFSAGAQEIRRVFAKFAHHVQTDNSERGALSKILVAVCLVANATILNI